MRVAPLPRLICPVLQICQVCTRALLVLNILTSGVANWTERSDIAAMKGSPPVGVTQK